jgi:diacylglycerol kinase (ATP)
VAAVGGDGTVHEVANGLMQAAQGAPTLPLAVVPLGSGDDFAKVIPPEAAPGGKAFGWQEAVAKIARGQTRQFDVGHMLAWADAGDTDARPLAAHYFVNGMDVGFGAQANLNLARMPGWLKGFAAYLAAILKTLLHYPRLQLRVQLDNEAPFELVTCMTAITNGRCFGSGFWVCPQARPDDGLLDLMLAPALGRAAILGLIPKFTRGTHVNEPRLRMARARRVLLQSSRPFVLEADGEMPFGPIRRLQVELLPGRLTVIA